MKKLSKNTKHKAAYDFNFIKTITGTYSHKCGICTKMIFPSRDIIGDNHLNLLVLFVTTKFSTVNF